ncbi:hypothetical protein B2G71_13795 [Novosphingobium sp. PC22D]|uniref:phosphatase domain-containing protein n=1 Tax=Novosphingobium sp. PC22D TaxID=1962403 RepID=UPI000BF03004|nr:phosphatase domain-containing protein [Novosphingobium sp. PC22D]PEQ12200.1 hypothetical protein B2G71_13795 [Novosphingobium sp. PC22D]
MSADAGPPRLLAYFGYRNADRLSLTVRALAGGESRWDHTSTFARLRALLRHYASREVPGVPITLTAGSGEHTASATCVTDGEGYCRFDVALEDAWPLPARTAWETVTLRWNAGSEGHEISGYVLAPGIDNRLAVISDIDDTIVETGAHELWRNWRRFLTRMPAEREPVPGAAALFSRLGGERAGARYPASRRPFFYVSSSPWNLFDYLLAFKSAHGLPHGPMLLRDWGFNRQTLLPSSHGAHKSASVAGLLGFYAETRFALIGDSTQSDALAYAEAVRRFPGRIAGVLIRKAPGPGLSREEHAALTAIERAGVPLWVGADFAIGDDFLESLGFAARDETKSIVETISTQQAAASGAVQAGETN